MKQSRSIIIITTPPHFSTAPKEALDMALALAVFNLEVSVVLHGPGVLHAIAPPHTQSTTEVKTLHGSLYTNLGALDLYDIPKVRVLEEQWTKYYQGSPPEWVELMSSFNALFLEPYQLHVY